ncbi:septum formation inhibitor [Rhodanobacter thiooxydans]|uniref:Probable septum site-determining protein MinC n=1 Tax=Rhodanobacter thiooxydans TaxID=416169 RepID=A0A154QG58_9GAMM|nr:septum site-determining protein MinC [Rhodanobacter thiooxydans]EIM03008.1 septum formation inhibitor [Rhodanobacter thiooxydans LCS2]KZC22791.1 septum formation inhibitor [Rhodanobacter thiooxydans]MCW0200620.1 septum site-determining protein MinC [Rhodanobacter thiooxydans]
MNAKAEVTDACDLRFGQVGIACVRVRRVDAAALCDELERRVRAAPQMFARAAVVLDLSHLSNLPDDGAVDALLEAVRSAGMLPVGLAYGTSETEALAKRMGLPLIAKFRAAYEPAAGSTSPAEPAPRAEAAPTVQREPILSAPPSDGMHGAQHHAGSVRSGQQVYARERDLIITGAVANGAEVIADGNIHIYGSLRGRAMAGAQGDGKARIFVSDFRAELVAIAGQYRVFEQIPGDLEGQSVQCWLEGDKLLIARL